jgi:hypothetical protein
MGYAHCWLGQAALRDDMADEATSAVPCGRYRELG